jgi:hypothetical protein
MYPLSLGFRRSSAASHEANNLEFVSVFDRDFAKGRSWNDLEIAFDGYANGIEAQLADQLGYADAFVYPAVLAVDAHLDCVIDRHERGADRNVRAFSQL